MTQEIKCIESSDCDKFQDEVNNYLLDGWKISSTYCGFVQSEQYDFCSSYHAILIKEEN